MPFAPLALVAVVDVLADDDADDALEEKDERFSSAGVEADCDSEFARTKFCSTRMLFLRLGEACEMLARLPRSPEVRYET